MATRTLGKNWFIIIDIVTNEKGLPNKCTALEIIK